MDGASNLFASEERGVTTQENKEGFKLTISAMHSAFPDMRVKIDSLVAESDLVVGHHATTGTRTGDFMGLPATGRSVKVEGAADGAHLQRQGSGVLLSD